MTRQSDASCLRFRGVAKCPTQACTIPGKYPTQWQHRQVHPKIERAENVRIERSEQGWEHLFGIQSVAQWREQARHQNKSDVIEGDVATVRSASAAHSTQDLNTLDIQEEGHEKTANAANDKFGGKVLEFMQMILNISYRQACAHAEESAAAGRRCAKMLIERPEQVKTFVHMVDSLTMIQMMDYCSMWFQ